MGFLFGLLLGGALMSGGSAGGLPPSLAEIPFRCFAVVEDQAAYFDCRRLSMTAQLWQQYKSTPYSEPNPRTELMPKVEAAMALELRALRALEAEAAKQKAAQR
jgi:hypothetical protein